LQFFYNRFFMLDFLKAEVALINVHLFQLHKVLRVCKAGNPFQRQENMDFTERKIQVFQFQYPFQIFTGSFVKDILPFGPGGNQKSIMYIIVEIVYRYMIKFRYFADTHETAFLSFSFLIWYHKHGVYS